MRTRKLLKILKSLLRRYHFGNTPFQVGHISRFEAVIVLFVYTPNKALTRSRFFSGKESDEIRQALRMSFDQAVLIFSKGSPGNSSLPSCEDVIHYIAQEKIRLANKGKPWLTS